MKVPCEACCGSGNRELSIHEVATIDAIGDGWSMTTEIAPRISVPKNIKLTALNNRLVRLESMGLVKRRAVNGKRFEWCAVTAHKRSIGREVVTTTRKAG